MKFNWFVKTPSGEHVFPEISAENVWGIKCANQKKPDLSKWSNFEAVIIKALDGEKI